MAWYEQASWRKHQTDHSMDARGKGRVRETEYKKNDILKGLEVRALSSEGAGIAKIEGYPLFIKDALPGDTVTVKLTKVKKDMAFARLLEIQSESVDRVRARCDMSRPCGGCAIQELSYEKQLEFKDEKVYNCLLRIGGIPAKVLDEQILAPLGFSRKDAWLCDLLPESRINSGQKKAIERCYNKYIGQYDLKPVTVPERESKFCDARRAAEILEELKESDARLLVLLGDIPIKQFLKRVADIPYSSLQEYVDLFGYGNPTDVTIQGKIIKVLPLAHPRQIGALGTHSEKWYQMHQKWEKKR